MSLSTIPSSITEIKPYVQAIFEEDGIVDISLLKHMY